MTWFRSQRRFGALVGLFALLFQFAVSFGHVHAPPVSGASFHAASADGAAPAGGTHHSTDPFCDICATTGLLAVGQVSDPPRLAPPPLLTSTPLVARVEAIASFARHAAFQSRAPPAA